MSSRETVCAVIALYRTEQHLLSEIIERLRNMEVTHVVIVNNGGLKHSFDQDSFISVYNPGMNLGTAGGFDLGMKKAIALGYDLVWLLDDDNLPEKGALRALLSELERLEADHLRSRLMLVSSRPFLFNNIFIHKKKHLYSFGPREKSYLGFHYAQFFEMLWNRLFRIRSKGWGILTDKSALAMDSAYYGGLFFHKSAVPHLSLNRKLFIYWDDLDFTNRFVQQGGDIYLITKSVIEDIGPANAINDKRHFLHHPFIDLNPGFKAFYYIRNLKIYEKRWSSASAFTYRFNKVVMLSMLWLIALFRKKPERFRLLIKSIKCAERYEYDSLKDAIP